eukprot:1288906-Amphidinium_carterae.1
MPQILVYVNYSRKVLPAGCQPSWLKSRLHLGVGCHHREVVERQGLAEHIWRFVHDSTKEECTKAVQKAAAIPEATPQSAFALSAAPFPLADAVAAGLRTWIRMKTAFA